MVVESSVRFSGYIGSFLLTIVWKATMKGWINFTVRYAAY